MDDEDQIYRGAFMLSLLGGGFVALIILLGLSLTGLATPFDEGWGGSTVSRAAAGYGMLRLVMGYATTFVLLKVMQSAGGGLVGSAVCRTAMALAFTVILLATFLPGWLGSSPSAPAAGPGSGPSANSMFAFNVLAVTVPHTVGVLIAGWIHGD